MLVERYHQHNLAHATLLSGPKGVGKSEYAKQCAALLLCDKGQQSQHACGQCASCLLMQAGTHPDYYELAPESSAVIKVDSIRHLIARLSQKAGVAKNKVIIINPVEALNQASSNAILKILEEPPAHCYFLLVHHLGPISATIRSRCQSQLFHPDKQYSWHPKEEMPLIFNALSGSAEAKSKLVQQPLARVLGGLESVLIDLIQLKMTQDEQTVANRDHLAMLYKMVNQLPVRACFSLMDRILSVKRSLVAKVAVNAQLVCEALLIQWMRECSNDS